MSKSKTIIFIACVVALVGMSLVFSQTTGDQQEKRKSQLFEALEKGNGEIARKLLVKNPGLVNAQRQGGWSPLHMCVFNPELIEYLIDQGADVQAQSGGGWTPLHSHAYGGTPEAIKLLIKHGAKVNQRNAFHITPVMNAVRWNKHANLRVLAENGAELNVPDSLGRTPLINASIQGFSKMTDILIHMGADVKVTDLPTKRTALHFAALHGHLEIVKQLTAGGADLNQADSQGKQPLFYACRYGHRQVAEFLKSAGAEGEIDGSRFGISPFLAKNVPDGQASIWFLGRIGYAVKTRNHFLVFSYYTEGNPPAEPHLSGGYLTIDEIGDQNITVFAGSDGYHHHNPKRYSMWQKKLDRVRFVYSFRDKVGARHRHYLEDVPGPEYIYLPEGEKTSLQGMEIESLAIPNRGTGFLVEVDGLVICHTGDLFLFNESRMAAYKESIQYLKNTGKQIDILFHLGIFPYGRLLPGNVQALDYSLKTLKPRSLFLMGAQHCEYLLEKVKESLKNHSPYTRIHAPRHQGDRFDFKKRNT